MPYDLLTDKEKKKNRERCQELLKYIQYQAYNLGRADRHQGGNSIHLKNITKILAKILTKTITNFLSKNCNKKSRKTNTNRNQ